MQGVYFFKVCVGGEDYQSSKDENDAYIKAALDVMAKTI